MAARKPQKLTPAQAAARGVDGFFEGILAGPEVLTDRYSIGPIEDVIEDVMLVVERDWIAEHGPITADQDVVHEMLGREAGYLVGVQVGLRLRLPVTAVAIRGF